MYSRWRKGSKVFLYDTQISSNLFRDWLTDWLPDGKQIATQFIWLVIHHTQNEVCMTHIWVIKGEQVGNICKRSRAMIIKQAGYTFESALGQRLKTSKEWIKPLYRLRFGAWAVFLSAQLTRKWEGQLKFILN